MQQYLRQNATMFETKCNNVSNDIVMRKKCLKSFLMMIGQTKRQNETITGFIRKRIISNISIFVLENLESNSTLSVLII